LTPRQITAEAPESPARLAPEERRELILAAARRVFTSTSYADAEMADVAREAGVARTLVNHYFGGKRALYLAVVEDAAASLPALARDLSGLPQDELVERNVSGFLDAVERDHEVWGVLLGAETVGRDPEVAAIMATARDQVVERMARNHSDSPSDELRLALRVFQGAAEAAAGEWLRRERASREQVHALLTRLLLALVNDVAPQIPPRRG
jgi:AcrR family transcriptional regulator